MSAKFHHFGISQNGEIVYRIVLRTESLEVSVLTYGAILQDVRLTGIDHPLTLGSPQLSAYEGRMGSFGALMGPVVNRIRDASAPIDGQIHHFEANLDGKHTKHGGSSGTQSSVWTVQESSPTHVLMQIELEDGLSGFPGNRMIRTEYRVDGATLDMVVIGTTDRPTLLNLANHSYWNLDGDGRVADHLVRINADRFTVNGDDLMATGEIRSVSDTRFDFRTAKNFACSPENRFDLNFCLSGNQRKLSEACEVTGKSGVRMTMATTEPGLQIFDQGSFETDPFPSHLGAPYPRFSGIALEAQGWPDAANHPHFPTIEFSPRRPYHQHTRWAFYPQ
jgi:aldose 1-epimerase